MKFTKENKNKITNSNDHDVIFGRSTCQIAQGSYSSTEQFTASIYNVLTDFKVYFNVFQQN